MGAVSWLGGQKVKELANPDLLLSVLAEGAQHGLRLRISDFHALIVKFAKAKQLDKVHACVMPLLSYIISPHPPALLAPTIRVHLNLQDIANLTCECLWHLCVLKINECIDLRSPPRLNAYLSTEAG